MIYNSLCRDSQDTKALCFSKTAVIHNLIIVGKVPFTSRRESLADYLDNGSTCGGHFAMIDTFENCGVYKITNTITGDFYIGSSCHLRQRFNKHRWSLFNNKHFNRHLQNSWNKYGKQALEFTVVLLCDVENKLYYEQALINSLKPTFNIAKNTTAPMQGRHHTDKTRQCMSGEHHPNFRKYGVSSPCYGKRHSEEAKQKMSVAHKGDRNSMYGKPGTQLGKHFSEEHKQALSKALSGRVCSEETKCKISESQRRRHAKTRAQTKSVLELKGENRDLYN